MVNGVQDICYVVIDLTVCR